MQEQGLFINIYSSLPSDMMRSSVPHFEILLEISVGDIIDCAKCVLLISAVGRSWLSIDPYSTLILLL